jgi:hypothetical protein
MSEEKKNEFIVVPELPQVATRTVQGENGEIYELITLTEAIKEILEKVREINEKV